MAFIKDPIDIEQYIEIYRREREMGPDKKLVAFTQTKAGRYTATWQDTNFQNVLWGNVTKLRKWMEEKQAAFDAELDAELAKVEAGE